MARRPPQTRYAQSSGAKIAYQVSGTGPPDLLMVHGLVSHLDLQWQQTGYRRFVRALEQGGRVIRLDKRGTGLSDPVAELPTTEQRVQDVAAVMAAARASRAVLFGLSDGGRAAIAFAAAHPGQTRGLILYGTSYRGPRAALLRRYRAAVRHWGEGRLADLVAPSLTGPAAAREAAGAFERAAASPGMAAALAESLGLRAWPSGPWSCWPRTRPCGRVPRRSTGCSAWRARTRCSPATRSSAASATSTPRVSTSCSAPAGTRPSRGSSSAWTSPPT